MTPPPSDHLEPIRHGRSWAARVRSQTLRSLALASSFVAAAFSNVFIAALWVLLLFVALELPLILDERTGPLAGLLSVCICMSLIVLGAVVQRLSDHMASKIGALNPASPGATPPKHLMGVGLRMSSVIIGCLSAMFIGVSDAIGPEVAPWPNDIGFALFFVVVYGLMALSALFVNLASVCSQYLRLLADQSRLAPTPAPRSPA